MKVWLDFCEPKSITMLRPLYNRLIKEHEVFITARDFDATYDLLNDWGVPYIKVGEHGGADLKGKLHSYIDRLNALLEIVEEKQPDFLFCITSPEAIRIAFGLGLPHIMFYDEPRSVGCSKLTLPMVDLVVVPRPIPFEWYEKYGVSEDRTLRFNGIDEVGWLNKHDFTPNSHYLEEFNLKKQNYIVFRTIATQSYAHLSERMEPHESLLTEIIPELEREIPNNKMDLQYVILPRYEEQYIHMQEVFSKYISSGKIILERSISHLADIMYFSSMVVSGGGTMVRESALLGVPSIEFIGSETYPQEQFLIDNGFPLVHVKKTEKIIQKIRHFLKDDPRQNTWDKIENLDNPIEVALEKFRVFAKKYSK